MRKNNIKYFDINKVIIIAFCFIFVLFISIIIYTSKYFNSKKTTSYDSSNVYTTGNRKKGVNSNNLEIINQDQTKGDKTNDNQTIRYFENVKDETDTYVNEGDTIKLNNLAKDEFVTLVDFIFYGTEINGITFSELKQETKDKLISIVNDIDDKIESKVPNYKEEIKSDASNIYSILSDKLHKGVTYVDGKIEKNIGTGKYNSFKSKVSDVTDKTKDKAKELFVNGKQTAKKVTDKIKNWYEGWK